MRITSCRSKSLFLICLLLFSIYFVKAEGADIIDDKPESGYNHAMSSTTSLISEVRLGLFAHNVFGGFIPNSLSGDKWNFKEWHDVNGEILFQPLNWFDQSYGTLRPVVGGTVSFNNKENLGYAGLAYKKHLFQTGLFLEGKFGVGVHDGHLSNPPIGSGMRRLGCRVQFHESASLGFDINEKMSVMTTYQHTSNADLCNYNAGLSNAGVRFGYKF